MYTHMYIYMYIYIFMYIYVYIYNDRKLVAYNYVILHRKYNYWLVDAKWSDTGDQVFHIEQ